MSDMTSTLQKRYKGYEPRFYKIREMVFVPIYAQRREFYDKKREEGKPFRVAIIACVNKLLHWIYALLKSRTTFQDIA